MDNKKQKKDILIKIACLICSFGLWLYISNVENPTVTTKVTDVPIEILNADVLSQYKLSMTPGQTFKVTLSIEGSASDVYRAKSDQFKLVIDLSTYALKKGDNNLPVEVIQSPNNVNVLRTPEMLKVNIILDDLIEKSVPINIDVDTRTKQGYYVSPAVTDQANAIVSGPAQLVNMVNEVVARGEAKDVAKDTELTLPLIAVDQAGRTVKDVNIKPSSINVVIPIRKSKIVDVNVKTTGEVGISLVLKSIEANPSKIEITGDDSVLKNISSIDTEPIDLSKITTNKDFVAKLKIPDNIRVLNGSDTVSIKVTTDKAATEELQQQDVQSKIQVKGLKEGFNATLEVDTLTVTLKGKSEVLKSIKEEDIVSEIDLTNLEEGDHEVSPKVTVKEGASLVKFTPEKIKVKITKK
ncbi:CdaR family protein [Clostridium frigidicarnis]|uniref:YbbR domain-containing protein n=1 Tax=Clostridium frigidicarnis TaxID=84698 RepID=A0A1I0Z5I9_9CLOT|nr:CdaR family protein [Clostridium frigidicarnis]SFB20617.1 YbbR domain-containing protein [Clostridium frigidicarnis]